VRIASARGRVITFETLEAELWQSSSERTRRRLAVLVSRLRSKLGPASAYIDTVRFVGYRMAPTPAQPSRR
jgi:two-component system phosphate regulon response regulator PhoB